MRPLRILAVFLGTILLVPANGQIVVTGGANRSTQQPPAIPIIVQLPTKDFVWYWGDRQASDVPELGDFSVYGTEQRFFCHLNGSFESIDPNSLRTLKNHLGTVSPYFIQEATARMNQMFSIGTGRSWATLTCKIPETLPTDEATQERLEKALERAERERDQRRDDTQP